jgi:hypothetical protein
MPSIGMVIINIYMSIGGTTHFHCPTQLIELHILILSTIRFVNVPCCLDKLLLDTSGGLQLDGPLLGQEIIHVIYLEEVENLVYHQIIFLPNLYFFSFDILGQLNFLKNCTSQLSGSGKLRCKGTEWNNYGRMIYFPNGENAGVTMSNGASFNNHPSGIFEGNGNSPWNSEGNPNQHPFSNYGTMTNYAPFNIG